MILENWNKLNEIEKVNYIIETPNDNYYDIWGFLTLDEKSFILTKPYINHTNYIKILNKAELRILYSYNVGILEFLDILNLDYTTLLNICRSNIGFDYEKYWDILDKHQKNSMICCRDDFNYEKYWE